MKYWVPRIGTYEIGDGVEGVIETLLRSSSSDARAVAAEWLGNYGDARAFLPLERVAQEDHSIYYVEGGFADRPEKLSDAARSALGVLASRIEPDPRDAEARRALAARAPRPVEAGTGGLPSPLDVDDEELRIAALGRDPYGPNLYREAMDRYSRERSPHVRRAIADLWIRMRQRMGDRLSVSQVMAFLTDEDVEVRRMIAAYVLETTAQGDPSDDQAALHTLAREVHGAAKLHDPKEQLRARIAERRAQREASSASPHPLRALVEQRHAQNQLDLEDAMRRAEETGKEPFDMTRFQKSGCETMSTEEQQRFDYYVMKSEIRTMAEYIALRKKLEPWEDSS